MSIHNVAARDKIMAWREIEAVFSSNGDIVYQYIYASLGFNGLIYVFVIFLCSYIGILLGYIYYLTNLKYVIQSDYGNLFMALNANEIKSWRFALDIISILLSLAFQVYFSRCPLITSANNTSQQCSLSAILQCITNGIPYWTISFLLDLALPAYMYSFPVDSAYLFRDISIITVGSILHVHVARNVCG